jgi:hypothetical protein
MWPAGSSNWLDQFKSYRPLMFTPAEWRSILEDREFLEDEDNSYRVPRRLMGLPVQIIPDHQFLISHARRLA